MVNVHRHFGVILKHHIVDGLMIQQEIFIGHEHRNQQIQLVLDRQQVRFLKKNFHKKLIFENFIDHTTGTDHGYYLYIETSFPQSQGQKARIISPMYSPSSSVCLRFYYHMFGPSIGVLNVLMAGTKQILWSKRYIIIIKV
jgi:hypothetical protein